MKIKLRKQRFRNFRLTWMFIQLFSVCLVISFPFVFHQTRESIASISPDEITAQNKADTLSDLQRQSDNAVRIEKTVYSLTEPVVIAIDVKRDALFGFFGVPSTERRIVAMTVIGPNGSPVSMPVEGREERVGRTTTAQLVLEPQSDSKPGKYEVRTELEQSGQTLTTVKSFEWGVIAVNVRSATLKVGTTTEIGMAVLDDRGRTLCDATVILEVTAPNGKKEQFTTEDGSVVRDPTCVDRSVTIKPDYAVSYVAQESGHYQITVTAQTPNGPRSIDDGFDASDHVLFDVRRTTFPTRIYPVADYPVTIDIVPTRDISGVIEEQVPNSFVVSNLSDGGSLIAGTGTDPTVLRWPVLWHAGDTYQLAYTFNAPDDSPFFYRLGPITIADEGDELFHEARQWQIASDATDNLLGFWDGGTAPTGWSCQSCGSGDFYQKFPRGAASYGGTGGATTHTHTPSWVSSGNNSTSFMGIDSTGAGTNYASHPHAHNSLTSASTGTGTNLPSYKNLKVIRYDTTGVPATIPAGFIGMFDATPPAGWTTISTHDTKFLYGENDATGTGGAATHTNTVSFTTGVPSATGSGGDDGTDLTKITTNTHTHTGSGTTASGDHTPPYRDVILAKADSDTTVPNGLITMWDDTPLGSGWNVISGASAAFDAKFIRANSTYGGTGGATTHTHSNLAITTASAVGTMTSEGAIPDTTVARSNHTHSITVSFDSPNNLPPYLDVIVAKYTATISISGTCDQFDQTTDCVDDGSNAIKVAVNGVSVGTDATVDGAWSVTGVTQPSTGDVITVFIDANADANEAVAVTTYSGSGNVAGIPLFQRHLVIGSDQNTTVTNANIASCDNDNGTICSGDEDVFMNVSAGNDLTVDSIGSYTDEELYVDGSDTFRPASAGGADVTTVSVENTGTWTADANAINVAGDWLNSGTFTGGTSTVTFTATSTGKTINAGSSSFNAVTFNGSGGAWSPLTNTMTIGGDLLVVAGTFNTAAGTASVVANGNVQCSGTCGTIDMTSAGTNTFTQSVTASKSFGTNVAVATTWTFYNLTFTSTANSPTITVNGTGTGTISVTNDLTTSTSGTALTVDNETNDRILDVDNDVTIGANTTLSASSTASFTVGGSWDNNGTFTANSGTIIFDSIAATETIDPAGSSFNSLTIDNGLVGYYKLDEATGTSTTADASRYGNTGTLTNVDEADWVAPNNTGHYGSNPKALNFDSAGTEYVDLGNPDQLNTGFTNKLTIAAWIKPTSGTGQVIVGKSYNAAHTSPWYVWTLYKTSLNRLHLRIDSTTVDSTSSLITDGSWQHVAGVYDGSLGSANLKVYLNGSQNANTANKTANIQSSSQNIRIAARHTTSLAEFFNGAIDDVRIYKRALSTSEISDLYNGNHPSVATYTLSSALDVNGNLTITAGKLDVSATNCSSAPCGVNIFGNYTNVGGFEPRTGTVTFDGTSSGKTIQADMPFYNLTVNGALGAWTLDKQRLDVNNDLSISNTATLDVSASSCTGAASCAVNVAGNWTNSATYTARTGTVTFDGTATGKTINPGSSSFYNLTFNGSGGAWSPLTNTVTATNDLTMTAGTFDTSSGTSDVTVNGTVQCGATCGTVNMTSTNTFTQSVATSKNFGPNVGTTAWTFYNLTHSSSTGTPTITFNGTGTGTITVSNNYTTSNSGTSLAVDADTNDRNLTVTGNVSIGAGTTLSATSSGTFNVGGTWTNSGTYTHNSGTVTFTSTATGKTINAGSSSFSNVTFNGSGGAWSPLTNMMTIAGDLTMTNGTFNTAAGTANVTVNGNAQCGATCGTIDMTTSGTNTFTQSVTANKSFGTNVAVATDWTFYNLTFTSTSGSPTITTNSLGTGEINITNDLTTSTSGTALTVDDETNDRIFDVDNDVTIGANTTLQASSTASFTVGGSWANSGTFTPNSGTMTLDSVAATETINNSSSSFNNLTINDGLVGYWKLDEGTGTSSVNDSSGYGATGTMTNLDEADWVAPNNTSHYGNNPKALNFDSSGSEYIDVGNPDQLNTGFTDKITLAAWIKPTSGTGQIIIGKPHSSSSSTSPFFKWLLYKTSLNRLHMRIDSTFVDGGSSEIVDGIWQHVAGVYDGSTLKMYMNGTYDGHSSNKTGNIQSSSINAAIGAGNFSTPNGYFNGAIDDVRVYNRALSTSELSTLASGTHPTVATYTLSSALDINSNLAVRTGKLDVSATNCSSAPCAITIVGNYTNVAGFEPRTGTVTFDGTASGKTIQADMPFYNLTFNGLGGVWTLNQQRLDVDNNLTITNGTLDVSATSCNAGTSCAVTVGANWSNSDTFTARTGTVTLDAGATGKTITSGGTGAGKTFYNLVFNNASGGWTVQTNSLTATNDVTLTAASSFTVNTGLTLEVDGNYSEVVSGANTTWTGSTLYLNGSGGMYDINTKTHGGDTFATLRVGASEDIASWDSTSTTVTIDSGGCLFSEDEGGTGGRFNIYGTCNSRTNEYWAYATDFDGAALGGSSRQADVRFASGGDLTIDNGDTLSILGQNAGSNRTLITKQSSGTYALTISGTISAQYYDFDYLNANGLNIGSTATVSELSDGSFDNAGAASASYVKVAGITSTKNFFTDVFDDNSDGTDGSVQYNVNGDGSGINWTFFDFSGNKGGESYDVDANGAFIGWKSNLTLSLSANSVDLGILNPSLTGSGNHTVTVTTNAVSGYSCAATEDGNLRDGSGNTIADVADGSVTTGSNEYGVSCSGGGCQLSGDNALSGTPLTVTASSGAVTSQATTVTYKASVSPTNRASNYSHIVTFTCAGTF